MTDNEIDITAAKLWVGPPGWDADQAFAVAGSSRDYCSTWPEEGHSWTTANITEHTLTYRHGVWYRWCTGCRYVDLHELTELVAGLERRLEDARRQLNRQDEERAALADRVLLIERDENRLMRDLRASYRKLLGVDLDEWVARELVVTQTHRDALEVENRRLAQELAEQCAANDETARMAW